MLNAIMLNVTFKPFMLSAVMLSVIMLSVTAPEKPLNKVIYNINYFMQLSLLQERLDVQDLFSSIPSNDVSGRDNYASFINDFVSDLWPVL
jgi:hypothetical protein